MKDSVRWPPGKRAEVSRRAVKLANDGWDVEEIAELFRGEGVDEAGGRPMSAKFAYGLVYYGHRVMGLPCRSDLRMRKGGRLCFGRIHKRRQAQLNLDLKPRRWRPQVGPAKVAIVATACSLVLTYVVLKLHG